MSFLHFCLRFILFNHPSSVSSLRCWIGLFGPQGYETQIHLGFFILMISLTFSRPEAFIKSQPLNKPARSARPPSCWMVLVRRLSSSQHSSKTSNLSHSRMPPHAYPMARLSLLIVFFDGNSLSFGDKLYILF